MIYGRLSFIRPLDAKSPDGHRMGLWRCECGTETTVAMSRVRNGYTKSCGCLALEISRTVGIKHGQRNTPEYSSWGAMRERCLNPSSKDYPRYGGNGVTVDPAFNDFAVFLAEVGPRPAGTSIDRIDTTLGYAPGNVRWATPTEQASNRYNSWVVEINGDRFQSVDAAAAAFGVSGTTIKRWCDGFFDPRRAHHSNQGFHPAKPGCRKWRKYAA